MSASSDDPRLSDEATGLPPLEELESDHAIVVLAWNASVGVVQSPWTPETQPVRYLHLRGLNVGAEGPVGPPEWVQIHIAVPVESCLDVAAALAKGTTDEMGDEQ